LAQAAWLVGGLWLEFVPMGLLAVAWATWVERRAAVTLGLERYRVGRRYLRGVAVGVGMYLALVGLTALFANVSIAPTGAAGDTTGVATLGAALATFVGWAVQGPAEELVARGWLLGSVGARYGPWVGVTVSSAVFASFHAFNPGFGLLPALNLFVAGTFFALYAVWEGGLWGVFALHAAWNWMQGNVLGLAVSGALPAGGALVDLEVAGPDWIAGGTFGLEGGVLDTFVESLGVLGMVYLLQRRRRAEKVRDTATKGFVGKGPKGTAAEGADGADSAGQ
jgi:membrane protease YdiL (CAAX protease family)